jgi:5-methylcytosine-specific restriction protein A
MATPPPTLGRLSVRTPRVRTVESRPSSCSRGYGYKWQTYTRDALAREPLCRRCAGGNVSSLASLIDHIEPVQGPDDPRFWDTDNHQPLCRQCHAVKTGADRRAGLTRKS